VIAAARKDGLLPQEPLHYVTKYLQQGIESLAWLSSKNMSQMNQWLSTKAGQVHRDREALS
jgi:hypothetical protein